jgi:hypothetical protein
MFAISKINKENMNFILGENLENIQQNAKKLISWEC